MRRRFRVAQIVTRFMAGAGGVALRGGLALNPLDYEVVFLIGQGDRLADEARSAGFEVNLIECLRPDISLLNDRRALRRLSEYLLGNHFDVVHTHSAKAGGVGRLAARRAGVQRIVHTYHGFPFHDFQSKARRAAYIRIERALGRITDSALAVGPGVAAEAIRRRLVSPEKVRTIGVGVPAGQVPTCADRAEARRLLGIPPGMIVVGTVGRLDYQKAPEIFIESLHRLRRKDVFGVWIGDGPLREKARRLVVRYRLEDQFLFAGERSDVASVLPGLDVFAMASRYEGLPCAVLEAMSAARPIVATAVNAVPDVVVAGETGLLVPPEDANLLSDAIGYLITNPCVADRFGSAARVRALAEMGPQNLGEVLDATYRDSARAAEQAAALEAVTW
ncbi:MAG: glycosyltransferase [Acidimicrobiales bacterium]